MRASVPCVFIVSLRIFCPSPGVEQSKPNQAELGPRRGAVCPFSGGNGDNRRALSLPRGHRSACVVKENLAVCVLGQHHCPNLPLIGTAFAAPAQAGGSRSWGLWRPDLPLSDFGSPFASGGPQGAATVQGAPTARPR